jgi:hypothetical protein
MRVRRGEKGAERVARDRRLHALLGARRPPRFRPDDLQFDSRSLEARRLEERVEPLCVAQVPAVQETRRAVRRCSGAGSTPSTPAQFRTTDTRSSNGPAAVMWPTKPGCAARPRPRQAGC